MKILDNYIFRRFLKTYLFTLSIIVLIICVIDYTEKVDDFIKKKAPLQEILFDYYLNFIPYWGIFISPLIVFIAVVFMTANMAARTEIIAILSSGVSFLRLLVPYLLGAAAIGLMTFAMVGYLIPIANKTRIAFEKKYVKSQYYFDQRDFHLKIAPDVYAYMESYSNINKTGYRFSLERIKGTQLLEKLSAEQITWDSTRSKWRLSNYKIRSINQDRETLKFGNSTDTLINLHPEDFESKYQFQETLTLTELENYISQLRSRGADGIETYLIEKYMRYANPFGIAILTFIGVIVSARKSRGGVGLRIALGFALAFTYIMFFILAKGIAETGDIPALLAVWLPNLIFAGVGIVLYKTVPR
ncbi:MAG: LptF/LptG family permease [Spirosomataceae bacterium]